MSSKLLTGFLAGVVIGILFAPDKGSETRKKMTQKGKDLKKMSLAEMDVIWDEAKRLERQ